MESNSEVININTATKEQLMKISGIGKTKAEAIIEYREKMGILKVKKIITKVKGIGKSTFEKIKDKTIHLKIRRPESVSVYYT